MPVSFIQVRLVFSFDVFIIIFICLKFEVRTFPQHRQEILDYLYKLNKELRPDIVFAPSIHDVHQDHRVIAEEARRAFKRTTLLSYELPWNNITFDTTAFVPIPPSHLLRKQMALQCYESQGHKEYFAKNFIESMAIMRGVQINQPLAEAFEVVRWIL